MVMLMALVYKQAALDGEISCCITHPHTVTSWYEAGAYT